jgi:hypothetical protein
MFHLYSIPSNSCKDVPPIPIVHTEGGKPQYSSIEKLASGTQITFVVGGFNDRSVALDATRS